MSEQPSSTVGVTEEIASSVSLRTPVSETVANGFIGRKSIAQFSLDFSSYDFSRPYLRDMLEELLAFKSENSKSGIEFWLYATMEEVSEIIDQNVNITRSKGGWIEEHWGPRYSVITARGRMGLLMSTLGLTPYQVEDTMESIETIYHWEPTNKKLLTEYTASAPTEGKLAGVLAEKNATPARVGTAASLRNFRLLLDLFKSNGVIYGPPDGEYMNPAIYPSKKMMGYTYQPEPVDTGSHSYIPDAVVVEKDEFARSYGQPRIIVPIQMQVKNTTYYGFFQTLNYTLDDSTPYSALYDFTFQCFRSYREAVFFLKGTAGRRPFSDFLG